MKILFNNPEVLFLGKKYVTVEDGIITAIDDTMPQGRFDRVIDCRNRLLVPGMYNCHTHIPMTIFRGYGEDLPLDRWLNEKIWPAEELLTPESVYASSMYTICEMLKNGIVSFSDMYNFCTDIARAVSDTGIKANICRAVLCFDPNADLSSDERVREAVELYNEWNNKCDGRIKIEMSLHAEYTNNERSTRYVADLAKKYGTGLHIHMSETEKEHNECIARHGLTPAGFFNKCGAFDVPVNAAHCVWVSDEDIALMAEKGVSVSHNPASNLKLGSGTARLKAMLDGGVNVALGTDSNASNNTQDIMKEMYLAALLNNGLTGDPASLKAEQVIRMASENGAKLQGRSDCGSIAVGKKADLVLIALDSIHNFPIYDPSYAYLFSANSSDVRMTMVDGKILYENGNFPTLDIEKIEHDMRCVCANYFKKEQ